MIDYHCLEIEFPTIDFSKYGYPNKKEKISKVHHSHLYARKEEIELRILFDDKTGFDYSLMD